MSDDRWFSILKDRERERNRLVRLARRRAARAALREVERFQRAQKLRTEYKEMKSYQGMMPNVKMIVTDWVEDEFGNLSRMIYADE